MSIAARLVALVPTRSRAARPNAHHRRGIVVMASATSTDASFVGRWTRDGSRSVNAEAYLASHGLDEAKAAERAAAPYEQEWRETGAEEGEFLVLTVREPDAGSDRSSTPSASGRRSSRARANSSAPSPASCIATRRTTRFRTSDRCT